MKYGRKITTEYNDYTDDFNLEQLVKVFYKYQMIMNMDSSWNMIYISQLK